MFRPGMSELLIIMVIALMVFGGRRLPEVGSGLGKAIKGFKKGLRETDEIKPQSEKKLIDKESK